MAVASLFEDLLDQYKIEQHIAEKQYTDLFQAYDVDDDRQVRIDILRAPFAEDSSFAGRFVNRARALAQVRHANIAQVLHIGKGADGAPYVAQTAVNGYPLTNRLEQLAQRNSPVNAIYALKIIRQLADALLLAERLELFHYDLQPDNVLLKNVTLPTDESVVLIDLFIPTLRNSRLPLSTEQSRGREFLAPEQRAGKDVTAAAHVYSLGAMLYKLLSGNMPVRPVTMADTIVNRLFGRATSLARERGDLSRATYVLVDRSLRKDPRGRFSSIESFSVALDNALAAEEVRLSSALGRVHEVERRPRAWLFPLLIIALFMAVGAVAARSVINSEIRPTSALVDSTTSIPTVIVAIPNSTATPESTLSAELSADNNSRGSIVPQSTITVDTGFVATPTLAINVALTDPPVSTSTHTPEPTFTSTASPTPAPPLVRVVFNLVNLRRGPGVDFQLAGNVTGGETLEVIAWNDDEENPWYLVLTDDGRIGWIAAEVVQLSSPDTLAEMPVAATLPPTPEPTSTSTPTSTPTILVTLVITNVPEDPGGGEGTRPPPRPTDEPTTEPVEPTRTPPSFTPSP